jgi:hypothetical protein
MWDGMSSSWLSAELTTWSPPILSNWTFQEGMVSSPWPWGPPLTLYRCLLLSCFSGVSLDETFLFHLSKTKSLLLFAPLTGVGRI